MVHDLDSMIAGFRPILAWLPGWFSAVIVVGVLVLLAVALHAVGLRLVRRSRLGRSQMGQLLIQRGAGPTRVALVLFGVGAAVPALGFGASVTQTLLGLVFGAVLLVVGWAAVAVIGLMGDLYLARYREGLGENALARKHVTQVRVLRRASQVLISLVSVGAALMTLPAVRQYGVSLFASAGAAGIIVGLAARPVLSNLLAGIQIALTQPIKVEDAVVVDGEWGWIEDITSTYVVIRIWDWRRLVVPISRFLEQPFQNWTRESASLIGSVHLYVDYTTPIDAVRRKLDAIVHESKLWDGNVVNLQVVEATPEAIQLRALVSAHNSSDAWDLRCAVREQLIAYLQAEMPHALPRRRLAIDERVAPKARIERRPTKTAGRL
jgi:small-conductance mechanosensitive channel